jgi:hypothetical protein
MIHKQTFHILLLIAVLLLPGCTLVIPPVTTAGVAPNRSYLSKG